MSTAYRDRGYWSHLARVTAIALAVGIVGSLVGYQLLASASYIQAFTHPGCGNMGTTPNDLVIEGTQDITYPSHDGLMLRAWYLPPRNSAAIILLPGLGGIDQPYQCHRADRPATSAPHLRRTRGR